MLRANRAKTPTDADHKASRAPQDEPEYFNLTDFATALAPTFVTAGQSLLAQLHYNRTSNPPNRGIMSTRDNRREPRININLPVTVKMPTGDHHYQTEDASFRGVFLTCPQPLQLRKLVRFTTVLRNDDEPLEMLGMVAHTVNQTDAQETGRSPGMGIQLYSVGKKTRRRWREFIREEYEKRPEVRDEVRKLNLPRVTVRMRNLEQLISFAENDLMKGGIFVRTSDLQKEGSEVLCEIIHPVHERPFTLEATVQSVTETPRRDRGMELAFTDVSEDALRQLVEFIESEDEVEELDVQMLEALD